MVLLFSSTYRLAVGHFFTKGRRCDQLHDLAMKVIKSIEKAGFAVTSLIGDNHVFNSKCFSLLSGGTTRPVVRWDILIIKTFLDCSTFLVTFAFFTIQNGFAATHMTKIANFFWHLTLCHIFKNVHSQLQASNRYLFNNRNIISPKYARWLLEFQEKLRNKVNVLYVKYPADLINQCLNFHLHQVLSCWCEAYWGSMPSKQTLKNEYKNGTW